MSVSSQGFILYRPLSRRRSKIKNKRHVWACRRETSPGGEQKTALQTRRPTRPAGNRFRKAVSGLYRF
nr:MAG TPA: hypothetical protein [Caudoviricetes sp.]